MNKLPRTNLSRRCGLCKHWRSISNKGQCHHAKWDVVADAIWNPQSGIGCGKFEQEDDSDTTGEEVHDD